MSTRHLKLNRAKTKILIFFPQTLFFHWEVFPHLNIWATLFFQSFRLNCWGHLWLLSLQFSSKLCQSCLKSISRIHSLFTIFAIAALIQTTIIFCPTVFTYSYCSLFPPSWRNPLKMNSDDLIQTKSQSSHMAYEMPHCLHSHLPFSPHHSLFTFTSLQPTDLYFFFASSMSSILLSQGLCTC
jgi:hypothetical protein